MMHFSKENRAYTLNGILFVALFAISSFYIGSAPQISSLGISPLLIAVVLGMFYGNTLHHRLPKEWAPGIRFCSKKLLRTAIVLYGFRISFGQMLDVGLQGLIIDLLIVASTLFIGTWLGAKVFRIDKQLAFLISSGAAICGAAAVLAVEDVLKSEAYKAALAVATVVIFGTLSMFLYPILQHADMFSFTDQQYGIFVGASVHEVAQVVVAGDNISETAGSIAVVVKMTRVLLLIPLLFLCSMFFKNPKHSQTQKKQINIPWFAFGFLAIIGFNSLHLIPEPIVVLLNQFDTFLLTMAMGAIGMETDLRKIKALGIKPFYLATVLFIWLAGVSYFLVNLF